MKVIVAFKNPQVDNPAACHAGLGITASNTAEMLTEHGLNAQATAVADGYFIRDSLRKHAWPGVTHIVMAAPFFDSTFMAALVTEFPQHCFAVIYHSNVGFLGSDTWSTGVLIEQLALQKHHKNLTVAGNSEKFCRAVQATFHEPCTLLPNLYYLGGPSERVRKPWTGGVLRIGTFGATRILKNLPTAAWAARIIAREKQASSLEFWVSKGREEGQGANTVLKSVRKIFTDSHTLIEAPWAGWLEFRSTIVRKMHLLLQPSFTESFNNVTADGVAEGVASVVGPAIDWTPRSWHANPDDASDIARVGGKLLGAKGAPRDGYKALAAHNNDAIAHWKGYLGAA